MHVLIIGSGGREHALAWKLAQSPDVRRLSAAPGNPGIAELGACHPIDPCDIAAILDLSRREKVGFVVVGPEAALAAGLVDQLTAAGIPAFGPTAAAAQVEASKAFTKALCDEAGIPTAAYARCSRADEAKAYLKRLPGPYVVKADGLAGGKGVVIATTQSEAERAIDMMLGGALGAAGQQIVIEEFLDGEEASFFALSDGEDILPLIAAQDHKRAFDGDKGPNTGGMGAYSPAPAWTPQVEAASLARIIAPAIARLAERGTPYRGVLFAGLMLTRKGPQLIEFNARFGDPECQVLMMRLESDLLPALVATAKGGLGQIRLDWSNDAAITVVLATRGYPGAYEKGSAIAGLDEAARVEGVTLFHAGTAQREGRLVAAGGRVLDVAARGATIKEARERAYRAIDLIDWPQGFFRRDIAWRALGPRA
jgi:phosphoribosylamine--glycine ligase